MPRQIAVIGATEADEETERLAREVGRGIAASGSILLCGGLGGVMEAAARGAKEKGGTTVGILPGTDAAEANEHIDIKIVTAMSHARNAIIARSADALIAVGGEHGTLSEIALGLKSRKRVVAIDGTDIAALGIKDVLLAKSPREAVELALGSASSSKQI